MERYNTNTNKIVKKYYCIYCGKVTKHNYEFEEYDKYDYYFCDCEGVVLDVQKQKINQKLSMFKAIAKPVLSQYKYEAECRN